MLLAIIASIVFNVGCAEERVKSPFNGKDTIDIIKDIYWNSERTLVTSASVKDTLVKSDVTFKQVATLYNEKEDVKLDFLPTAYLNVRLSEKRIEVKTVDKLPVTLAKEYIKSQTPYKSGTTLGQDVVKVFEYSDGQVATVSYGHRYNGFVQGEDTLATPHLEITPVDYAKHTVEKFGDKTETEDPYKVTLLFNATYTSKGVSGKSVTDKVELKPWYHKVITSESTTVTKVEYSGKFVGCPYSSYELTEKVTTNKGELTNKYSVGLSLQITAPKEREQPSLDSLFNGKSAGKLSETMFSELKNEDGFTVRTMTGTYVSTNTGKQASTSVESTASFTYQFPTKFESKYGSYTIPAISLKFSEVGFSVNKTSETADSKLFKSVNAIYGEIAGCTLDVMNEVVNLKIQKDKPADVLKVDSTYTLKGEGDSYIVEKVIIWSDGSKTSSTYSYDGRHQASAKAFGEVVTTALNWRANDLAKVSNSTASEEKKFSATTKFTALYTTSNWQSNATNGMQNGIFAFSEMSPVVTFIDGNITKVFPERKYVMTGLGAQLASGYSTVIRNGVTYKAYAYDYTVKALWNSAASSNLVSNGLLLMKADEIGDVTYTTGQSWNGNTTTVKVIKTTPHTEADDEVETFTKDFTVIFGNLADGKLYADNLNFSTTETHTGSNSPANDGNWTVKTYSTTYTYNTTNNVVKREQSLMVRDAEITFNDGTFSHTFNVRLTMGMNEKVETSQTHVDGDYNVTPHQLTALGSTVDGRKFTTTGITGLYVKKSIDVTGHSKKTVVYSDGTVDFILEKKMSDGSTKAIKASDTYGSRFAFNFKNTTAQTKTVDNASHTASGNTGNAITSANNQGSWKVTEYAYPYTHTLSNGIAKDKLESPYSYSNYTATYNDADLGTVTFDAPIASMSNKSLDIRENGTDGDYAKYAAAVVVNGSASGTEGSYKTDLAVTHTLKVQNNEPDEPNLGKPKDFVVTATFDPTAKVTRRAFLFRWEDGVTYAVCDYETMLPDANDFAFKTDAYEGYNSVGYDKNSTDKWQPARGSDESDAIRWYFSDGSLMAGIDKGLSCPVIGWKNIVNGKYALVIPGYTYTISGYNITVKAPNGQTVTFNSHHK